MSLFYLSLHCCVMSVFFFFFFKQKTAYEMRISDWSSDVCSSDLLGRLSFIRRARDLGFSLDQVRALLKLSDDRSQDCASVDRIAGAHLLEIDRKLADLTALRRELKAVIDRSEEHTSELQSLMRKSYAVFCLKKKNKKKKSTKDTKKL